MDLIRAKYYTKQCTQIINNEDTQTSHNMKQESIEVRVNDVKVLLG